MESKPYGFFVLTVCVLLPCSTSVMALVCQKGKATEYCTDQLGLPGLPDHSCVIHQTPHCQNTVASLEPPLQKLESEEVSSFNVDMFSYVLNNDSLYTETNMTFRTHDNDILAFLFYIQDEMYRSCRKFDFAQVKERYPEHEVNFYYNCYKSFDSGISRLYNVTIRASPINKEFIYRMYAPKPDEIRAHNLCDWRPLALMNMAALPRKIIDLKFTPLDFERGVDMYTVELSCGDSKTSKNVSSLLPPGRTMLRETMAINLHGYCSVAVVPLHNQLQCAPNVLFLLFFPQEPDISPFPWYYLLVVFIVFLIVAAVLFYVYRKFGGMVLSHPKVLVLYSEDCEEHLDVVIKLCEFWKNCCSLDIILDKWNMGNQGLQFWIPKVVQTTPYIVLIVSEGVKHKIERENNPAMIERDPWGDRFTPAYNWLLSEVTKNRNTHLIKVILLSDYAESKTLLVPRILANRGETFYLMNELNQFLIYIHKRSLRWLSFFRPTLPGSRYLSYPEGKALDESLKELEKMKKENPNWFELRLKRSRVLSACSRASGDESSVLLPIASSEV